MGLFMSSVFILRIRFKAFLSHNNKNIDKSTMLLQGVILFSFFGGCFVSAEKEFICKRTYSSKIFDTAEREHELKRVDQCSGKARRGGKKCTDAGPIGLPNVVYPKANHDDLNMRLRKMEEKPSRTIKPTPWLTAGNYKFYGNFFTDYSIYTHFFAHPAVHNGKTRHLEE